MQNLENLTIGESGNGNGHGSAGGYGYGSGSGWSREKGYSLNTPA